MWKNLNVSVYDLFGYFLPGAVTLAALFIFWASGDLERRCPPTVISGSIWVVLGIIAYFLGHLVQAIANLIEGILCLDQLTFNKPRTKWEHFIHFIFFKDKPVPDWVRQQAEKKVREKFDPQLQNFPIDDHSLAKISEQALVMEDHADDREIYVYREGFYRGSAIAFVILAVALASALLLTLFAPHLKAGMEACSTGVRMGVGVLSAAFLISLLASFLSFRRFVHFHYLLRVTSLMAFVLLKSKTASA